PSSHRPAASTSSMRGTLGAIPDVPLPVRLACWGDDRTQPHRAGATDPGDPPDAPRHPRRRAGPAARRRRAGPAPPPRPPARAPPLREHAAAAPDRNAARPDPATTSTLVAAVAASRCVEVTYRSEGGKEWTTEVDPWAVVVRHGRWYLLCHSHSAQAVRTYRI